MNRLNDLNLKMNTMNFEWYWKLKLTVLYYKLNDLMIMNKYD